MGSAQAMGKSSKPRFAVAVHGGAGVIDRTKMSGEKERAYRSTLREALQIAYGALEGGGSSTDAVEVAIRHMEDSPLFNAGKGSVYTHEGTIEMDASFMDGANGNAGAVAGVTKVKNPISAARAVMVKSPHVMLAGEGADAFAKAQGLTLEKPEYFRTEQRWEQLQRFRGSEEMEMDHGSKKGSERSPDPDEAPADKFGTVGVVALDKAGNLAAGTSTGGMSNKRFGRVGDSPIIGSGTWARNSTCAVSCTGHGEFFMRENAAHSVSARMEYGKQSLKEAARAVIFEQLKPIGGEGGLIAIDKQGHIAMPFNTPGMFRGFMKSDGSQAIEIWRDGEGIKK
jgi:beta-aspartyl-peptidase (threonine type)